MTTIPETKLSPRLLAGDYGRPPAGGGTPAGSYDFLLLRLDSLKHTT